MLAAPKEALSTNVKQDGKSIDKKGGGGLRTHITHSLLRSEQCTMASTRPKGRREGAFLKTNFKFGLEVALEKKYNYAKLLTPAPKQEQWGLFCFLARH